MRGDHLDAATLVGSLRGILPEHDPFDSLRSKAFLAFSVDLLSSLSHPTRLRIVSLLRNHPMTVSQIQVELELGQANVSQHLQILVRAGVLLKEAHGASRVYALRDIAICELLDRVQIFWQSHKEDIAAERLG